MAATVAGAAVSRLGARRSGPDAVKGALIVAVVLGHMIDAPLVESFPKWLLYGFHMPAFLVLAGWLLGPERLAAMTWTEAGRRYGVRMVLPWLGLSVLWSSGSLLLRPFHHLWFVPAFLLALAVCRWALRAGWAVEAVSVAAWAASVAVAVSGVVLPFDHRYVTSLAWVALGLHLRAGGRAAPWWVGVLGGVVYVAAFWIDPQLGAVAMLVLNLAAAPLFLRLAQREWRAEPLEVVGRWSLWIYLLHPLVLVP